MRVHANTTILTVILRGRLLPESAYKRVYTVVVKVSTHINSFNVILIEPVVTDSIKLS